MDNFEKGESIEETLEREIDVALSPVYAKTTQELLPGYLPDKPRKELTPEELDLYGLAYEILSEKVREGSVEVIFDHEEPEESDNEDFISERVTSPKFKLVHSGGKKERDEDVAWNAQTVTET